MKRPLTLKQAQERFPHRYTLEHVPQWAKSPQAPGRYYAPQYESDAQWYDRTVFPGEAGIHHNETHCMSMQQSWPLGQWLDAPYKGAKRHAN